MGGNHIIHGLFLVLSTITGYSIASRLLEPGRAYTGGMVGFLVGGCLIGIGIFLEKGLAKRSLWGFLGASLGILSGMLFNLMVEPLFAFNPSVFLLVKGPALLFFSYVGLISALKIERDPGILFKGKRPDDDPGVK